jgi:hypothetical protein
MFGSELTKQDLQELADCYITQALAERAGIWRVTSAEGSEIVGRNGKPGYEGLIFPYFWPGESQPREYRLRRDHPDLERTAAGTTKLKNKFMSPPGRGNHIYFPPDIPPDLLEDTEVPVRITEGEKKTLALWRLAMYEAERPRFLPIGLSGVWNWRGSVGKETGPNGERVDVKGVISDLDRIEWVDRHVDIVFDANVATNSSVQAARRGLADELQSRRAQVFYVNIPIEARVNGIDDLLASWGPERVLDLIKEAEPHYLVLSPNDPMRIARTLIAHRYLQEGVRTIHYHEDTFYTYTGTHYREVENSEIRSAVYRFLEGAKRRSK